MILLLFLMFTAIPIFEIYLLIQVGELIGTLETIWLVLFTGIIGAWAAKTQGEMVWRELQSQLQSGQMPADTMIQGLMIFVGGALLITPGIVTDIVGFSLVVPPPRYFVLYFLKRWIANKVKLGQFKVYTHTHHPGSNDSYQGPMRDVGPEVIEVSPNTDKKS